MKTETFERADRKTAKRMLSELLLPGDQKTAIVNVIVALEWLSKKRNIPYISASDIYDYVKANHLSNDEYNNYTCFIQPLPFARFLDKGYKKYRLPR